MIEPKRPEDYIYLNLDFPDITKQPAQKMLKLAKDYGVGIKLGTELTVRNSWIQMLELANRSRAKIFADTKANDIPRTVEATLSTIFRTHPDMINIHASAGEASLDKFMSLRDSTQSVARSKGQGSLAIAVTLLTSKTDVEIRDEYNGRTRLQQSRFYAQKAADFGFDGITCSANELKVFNREGRTRKLAKVVLGVRPEWAPAHDQAYTITPADAVRYGAFAIGIGRPIYDPPPEIGAPTNAIEKILEEIETAL